MSIKKSLRTILIISSIIPVVIVSVLSHGLLSNRFFQIQKENLTKSAELTRSGLEAMIETQKSEILTLTYQEDLIYILKEGNKSDPFLVDSVNQMFQSRMNTNPYFRLFSLYNEDGLIISSSDINQIGKNDEGNLTLSYLCATGKPAVAVSGIISNQLDSNTSNTIEIGYPINDEHKNTPIGYLIGSLHLSYFDNFLDEITFGETGSLLLLNRYGDILYHPDDNNIGKKIDSSKLSNLVSDFNNGKIQISGTSDYYFDGSSKIFGYCVIPELDWVLLARQDSSEVWSMTSLILTLLILICAVLLVIIIIFAHSLSKKFTEPIISIRDAMRIASDGDLSVQSNIRSKNELGDLSKNFNKMIHIIKTNYEDLSSMHEELLSNEEQLRNNYDHIEYLAYHDTLTNLPNKLAFLDYVNASLISSSRANKSHAIFFIDLDDFKTVNDTLGHEYGDSLLVKTARILSSLCENSMLARAGGDEFLIFKEYVSSNEEVIEFAQSIINCFNEPIEISSESVYISLSIGIAIYPDNGLSSNALIKNADIAMYKSKDTGKNKYTLFDSEMENVLNRNTSIVEILRNAIESNNIYLQYQPQYELETNSIVGFEALMRIHNERMGFIVPEEFIPVAEESGTIIELSAWLIKEACKFNKKLIDHGITPRHVSVNISSVQINRPGFVEFISDTLEDTGLSPEYLDLEITESTLVSSIMDASELLNNLKDLGVKISLDDFGTGYSSLNYLTSMPIDTLKIDKSFVDNIYSCKKDAHIVESIITLAHSLNIKVVAEGVETEGQLELLKSKNCDIVQGFVFSPPLHPEELEDLIRKK